MIIPNTSRSNSGFTLLESLCVIVVLSVLLVCTAPPMLNAIRASRLTSAGEFISGKLVEAQGLALTLSSDVELRLYKAPTPPNSTGESGQYVQLFHWVETGAEEGNLSDSDVQVNSESLAQLKRIGAHESLPVGLAISEQPEFSSVWSLPNHTEETPQGSRSYVAIRFRPDGSTDLPETGRWYITLVDDPPQSPDQLSANFYTLQIDPVTAKLDIYRPE